MRREDLTDYDGYSARRDEIDQAILTSLDEGPKTHHEINALLFRMGVGDAKTDERMALSYSTTGAISRAARNSLRARKLIYDTWDMENKREQPFKFYKRKS